MVSETKKARVRAPRPARRIEGQRAVVYYGRPVAEWPHSWML